MDESRSWMRGYAIALVASAIAVGVRVYVAPDLFRAVPTMPFFVAMLAAAWYGGVGPGLLATLIGAVASSWFLFPPLHSLTVASPEDQLRLAVFVALGGAISLAAETLHATRERSRVMHSDLVERQRMADDLRRLAGDLEEAARYKDRFLATLSHELRNPLAPMRSALQVMKLSADEPIEVEKARMTMERQLAQMVRLIDDLLDVSRITRDRVELRPEETSLKGVIDAAVETARPLIALRGHRLEIALPAEPVFLRVDPTRIAQVFSNLLNNAAKYTDPGGEIRIVAELHGGDAQGREVRVAVLDNGMGVAPDLMPYVMDLFVQSEEARSRAGGGLGIGLSLARRMVELHAGRLSLSANPAGRGTEVEVWLPALPPVASEIAKAAQAAVAVEAPRRRIMVADDNVDAADTLATLLEMMGHKTCVAHDGPEALRLAGQFRPDVVLLDIGMPGMDGLEVCRRLRASDWAASAAIVAVTGWGQREDRERSRAAGFDLHLVKPLDPAAIEGVLADLARVKMA